MGHVTHLLNRVGNETCAGFEGMKTTGIAIRTVAPRLADAVREFGAKADPARCSLCSERKEKPK